MAFLRDIGNRITASILAPREETLAIIHLILGAIAGSRSGCFHARAGRRSGEL
ncbi:hypothetical protein [Burkholderia sp. Bp8998]|uniref:hypothetical protein n=1 Tax=Burkholderia sp. Bp8998 TaxID=2184557 RepID=UPI00163A7D7B|nr:hypothetical protein [Burkholderia sp. Bp8998]